MRSRNSSRRLRFASVSRSTAWSDFFSAADSAGLTTAGPSTNSSLRRGREPVVRVTRLPSDPDASQPEWRSGRILPELDGSSVRACSAPALLVRSPAAGGRSSPHTQDSPRTTPPASGSCHAPCRAPQISCAAGRPRRLSPSSSSPQSLASSTLHHHCYRLSPGRNENKNAPVYVRGVSVSGVYLTIPPGGTIPTETCSCTALPKCRFPFAWVNVPEAASWGELARVRPGTECGAGGALGSCRLAGRLA